MCIPHKDRVDKSMEESSINETESNHIDDNKFEDDNAEAAACVEANNDNQFWSVLQSELNVEIPSYVKNIMRLCHLDKPLSFRCIREETIAELEKFVRKSMIYQLMGLEVNLEQYYGPFHKMPSKFRFAIGDRFLVKQLVSCAKSKSDEFWKRVLSPTRRSTTAATATATTRSTAYHRRTPRIIKIQSQYQEQEHEHEQEQGQEQGQGEEEAAATSELEEEEDKPPEAPLSLEQERRKLVESVRSSLLKEDYGEGVEPEQVANRVKARVTVKTSEGHDVVTAFIKCVFCPTRLMIRKQAFGSRKPRWVISNYRRHIRFHLDGKLRRPSAQDFAQPSRSATSSQPACKSEFYAVNVDGELHDDDDADQITTEMEYEQEDHSRMLET